MGRKIELMPHRHGGPLPGDLPAEPLRQRLAGRAGHVPARDEGHAAEAGAGGGASQGEFCH